MEFSDVVRRRRMVRNYDPDRPVPDEVRERILENGLRAPSGGFSQGWAFLTLEGDDRERYWRIAAENPDEKYVEWITGLRRAPLLILAFAHKDAYLDRYTEPDKGWTDRDEGRWTAPYWYVDTGMAVLLMLQTVVDEGLGACFFGPPADKTGRLLKEFGVPEGFDLVGVLSVGHRAPDKRSPSLKRGRRTTAEVVHRGHWGNHTE
ncbi:nitroreductase family protein [Kribbella shirazensis]|jgi:nitroreductase|uniref:Nitroreductase n=1 Tax=Kribbella shirazensis TaxID=1105143 RepID=A0A7X6A192_9ACTN|nr:nitroreductase family protein [Kribbella shirazensis]NIK56914.1 nitroreductase [Kribbella shirazensis]